MKARVLPTTVLTTSKSGCTFVPSQSVYIGKVIEVEKVGPKLFEQQDSLAHWWYAKEWLDFKHTKG